MSECSRLTVIQSGAYVHAWGDVTPLETKYDELIHSQRLPEKQILTLDCYTVLDTRLINPRAMIVSNLTGKHLATYPDAAAAEILAGQVLLVGLTDTRLDLPSRPKGWQALYPSRVGQNLPGSTTLWLAPETRVVLVPRRVLYDECPAPPLVVQVLVIPGNE